MLQWNLNGGGDARVERSDGVRVTVLSSRPFPPGATLCGRATASLPGELPAPEFPLAEFQVKVRDCRATDAGTYRVEGRFVSLAKPVRLALLRTLEARSAPAQAAERP